MPSKKPTQPVSPIGEAMNLAAGAVNAAGKVGKAIGSVFGIKGFKTARPVRRRRRPGARPGIEGMPDLDKPPKPGQITIRCIDYSPDRVNAFDVDDLEKFLADPRPDWVVNRWINVDGLHPWVVNRFRHTHRFHSLAAGDTLEPRLRPKVDTYDDHVYLVIRMAMLRGEELHAEQVSIFCYADTLITFQEMRGDMFDPIRERINTAGSRHRLNRTGYLLYAILDAVVDHGFPILERYGDELETLEQRVMQDPDPELLQRIHGIKRELMTLRRMTWPMREVVDTLYRDESGRFSDTARTYLREVYDHAVQLIDIIETHRELAGGLTDLYMSAVSNRMNEIMKVLTIMATLFIPITFIAGVYGMNFEFIPELGWKYAYPTFWGVCLATVATLLIYFRRKGWLGG